jgi:GAF domain-containing protein
MPMLRGDAALGAVGVARTDPAPFSDRQIALLQTFTDQAVIAIENLRLFKELEARNAELTESLAHQTATSEILRVISRSTTDVQPVFDGVVRSAVRLCRGLFGSVIRFDGELLHFAAQHNFSPEALAEHQQTFPRAPGPEHISGRVVLTRSVVHVPDVEQTPDLPVMQALRRGLGFRAIIGVPMLREGEPIGAIVVSREAPEPFSDTEIELLKTFADQSVIAIENARLLTDLQARTEELTRSVDQLTALGEVGRAVSSTLDLETLLDTIVTRAVQLSGTSGGLIYEYDEASGEFHLRATHRMEDELVAALRAAPVRLGEGATGRAAALRTPVQVPDIPADQEYALPRLRPLLDLLGYRSLLSVPLLFEQRIMARSWCGGVTRAASASRW